MIHLITHYFEAIKRSYTHKFNNIYLDISPEENDFTSIIFNGGKNAWASKEKIFVSTQLLAEICHNKEHICMVLGHEFGHIYYGHPDQRRVLDTTNIVKERQADCFAGVILKKIGLCPVKGFSLLTDVFGLTKDNNHISYPNYETRLQDITRGKLYGHI